MKSGKYSWLKKNPIVLLLRRLYRFLFKPKQDFIRFNPEHHLTNADQNVVKVEIEGYDDELATISQLFEQVNWHNYPVVISEKSDKPQRVARKILTDQDPGEFATVGELFRQVKWRVAPKVIQEQLLTSSKKSQAHDISLN